MAGGREEQGKPRDGPGIKDKYVAGGRGEKNVTKVFQQEPGAKGQGEDYLGQQQQSANSALLMLLATDKYVAGGRKEQSEALLHGRGKMDGYMTKVSQLLARDEAKSKQAQEQGLRGSPNIMDMYMAGGREEKDEYMANSS